MNDKVNDVSDFLKWVSEVRKHFKFEDDDPFQPWFRGHDNADWQLTPKLYRGDYGDVEELYKKDVEDEILEEFIVRAPILSANIPAHNDKWGWLFLMQHFGAPTRLLDWTEGALLALCFAVKDNNGENNAIVWALDPYELNKRVTKSEKDWIIPASAACVSKEELTLLNPWLPVRLKEKKEALPEWPIAIYPSHTERRISTQWSCFTVHGSNPIGLDEPPFTSPNWLKKIIIPSEKVQLIRKELLNCGIDESTIFPDLNGLGKSLHLKWLARKK